MNWTSHVTLQEFQWEFCHFALSLNILQIICWSAVVPFFVKPWSSVPHYCLNIDLILSIRLFKKKFPFHILVCMSIFLDNVAI